MAPAPWTSDELYSAARTWVDNCLLQDGSLFTPGRRIWTNETIAEAAERLLVDDIRKLDYTTKLKDQTTGLSDEALQLTAELLYVQLLPIGDTGAELKRQLVQSVLGWMARPISVPDDLLRALDGGVAHYGAGNMQRDRYVKYFVRFAVAWTELAADERLRLVDDPWAFRDFVHGLGGPALMQREAILHLFSPETFEYALAPNDKVKIVKAFAWLPAVVASENEDRSLSAIREAVERATGRTLDLYAPWFTGIWRDAAGPWDEAVRWASLLFSAPEFEREERTDKLTVGERMQSARAALLSRQPDWLETLKKALASPNNMTQWQYENGPFLRWCEAESSSAEAFLRALWASEEIDAEGIGEALNLLPQEVLSSRASRLTLASVLLFALGVTSHPPYRVTVVTKFEKLVGKEAESPEIALDDRPYTSNELAALLEIDGKRLKQFLRDQFPRDLDEKGEGWELPPELATTVQEHFSSVDAANPADVYRTFVTLLDDLRIRLLARGVELRDRLDAQSLVWWFVKNDPPESWSDDDKRAFLAFRAGQTGAATNDPRTEVQMPGRAWLIRGANVEGRNLVPDWIEHGFVSIGWPDLGQLSEPITREELAAAVANAYPEDPPGALRASVGNLHRFLNLMRPGDFAVAADGDKVYVGRVTGDPSYDPSAFAHARRRRAVEWLNAADPASRGHLATDFPTLYSRMRTLLTITDLKEDVAAVAALAGLVEKPETEVLSALSPADAALAGQVYLPQDWLQEVIDLLVEKRQLIFYGPPGTGKTFLAQRLAEHLTKQGGGVEIVQFHPSYGYEDFFEGYRPAQTSDGVGVTYELTPGPLMRIAEAAAQDPTQPYVLVIDEINRGNLPKIFGELLFLLEYRDAQIPLQYSPESQFGLPKNLFLIGTMNTADRSVALVDAALRRRFYFVPFMPSEAPVRDVLAAWLKDKDLDDRPARFLTALNERIANEEIAIGPSYFMTSGSVDPDLKRIWKYAILPVLEEHFYGVNRDVEAEFGLDALEKALSTEVSPADASADEAEVGEVEDVGT